MKKILVLGAGMVSRPLVSYLLDQENFHVKMASRTLSKAEKIIDTRPNGEAVPFDITKDTELDSLVMESDLVVSLLPYAYHVEVANHCIEHGKPMVTTSYVSDAMRALDDKAKDAGIILLNEIGVDPGIDHMSAMKIIHEVEGNAGKILSFKSTTGALPSHEVNTNPFGYKFSWSPRGVLLASRNAAKWLEDGREKEIPGEQLFENYYLQDVAGVGTFENYPNRNSIPYKELYGLKDAKTVYRGTFRIVGWCETLRSIVALGWLSEEPVEDFSGKTYGELTAKLIGSNSVGDLSNRTAEFLGIKPYSAVIKRLGWLGLFSDDPLPTDRNNPLDYLNVLSLKKMPLREHERDMIIMHHEFKVEYPDKNEYITSTLVDYGIPDGDSSVARTVSLPAAIAVKLILQGKITLTGVHIPVVQTIYEPVLQELETLGISFKEKSAPLVS